MKLNYKKYWLGYSLIILSLVVSSCNKYLDEKDKSNFLKDNYFTSPSQAQTFVNGIYTQLHLFQNGDAYGESPFITIELFAGHATSLGQSVNMATKSTNVRMQLTRDLKMFGKTVT